MRYTATITAREDGFEAQCDEIEAAGEGKTREEALASLRQAILDRVAHPEGVALPEHEPRHPIEISVRSKAPEERSHGPFGPGDEGTG